MPTCAFNIFLWLILFMNLKEYDVIIFLRLNVVYWNLKIDMINEID